MLREGCLRRALSPLGPPRSLQWQVQYPEPPEGAAARVVAAGPPSLSAVAGAVPRASRRGCGARCRRWAPCGSVRYCHCDLQSNGCDRLRIALTHSLNPLTHSTYSLHSLTPLTHSLTHSLIHTSSLPSFSSSSITSSLILHVLAQPPHIPSLLTLRS